MRHTLRFTSSTSSLLPVSQGLLPEGAESLCLMVGLALFKAFTRLWLLCLDWLSRLQWAIEGNHEQWKCASKQTSGNKIPMKTYCLGPAKWSDPWNSSYGLCKGLLLCMAFTMVVLKSVLYSS